jgi:branched-chain amino acid aminotransferase
MAPGQRWSKTWSFYEGDWHEGNIPIMGVRSHAAWLCSSVFDGARTFESVSPDLDLHCARVNASAATMHLKPIVSAENWLGLTQDGIKRFGKDAALYIRPMYWAERSGTLLVAPDPESARWCLTLYEAPMRPPEGFSITLSPYRKPSMECMPVDAKAGCLYPNNARALIEANSRGFGNCAVRDLIGNVAELATANVFTAKDGVVFTPAPNGTFLNGITRQRVIKRCARPASAWWRRRCNTAISRMLTRFSLRAITPRLCRSIVSTTARCNQARSTARRGSFIGTLRIHRLAEKAAISVVLRNLLDTSRIKAHGFPN